MGLDLSISIERRKQRGTISVNVPCDRDTQLFKAFQSLDARDLNPDETLLIPRFWGDTDETVEAKEDGLGQPLRYLTVHDLPEEIKTDTKRNQGIVELLHELPEDTRFFLYWH